jgi:hypothetical protein
MNPKTTLAVLLCVLWFQAGPEVARGQPAQAPGALGVSVGVALDIPGVVRGGTPIEWIQTGFDGLDDPIGLTGLANAPIRGTRCS